MGQFFIGKMLLGLFVVFVLPLVVFFYRDSTEVIPAVPDVAPTQVHIATRSTSVSVPDLHVPPQREQPSVPQVVKIVITPPSIATTTKPSLAKQTISTPGALVVASSATISPTPTFIKENALDEGGIIAFTNVERVKVGLPPLAQNGALSLGAEAKARDMIATQYFAHVAPDGTDIAALAETYGYDYLNIGENLALGDFHSSPDVVSGWMNSPGHRANILNKEFTEIGVAAVEGNWKGERVWFAVQEFGRPTSACPRPDALLKDRITAAEGALASLDVTLKDLQSAIDAAAGDEVLLMQKTYDYNAIVISYNALVADTKTDVARYNTEVAAFNTCAGF